MLAMWNLATLKTAGQQRVAVLVADVGEVLAGHTDAGRPGALQTINEVPFLFRHRSLLVSSTSVLVLVRGDWSRAKTEDSLGSVETFAFRQARSQTASTGV